MSIRDAIIFYLKNKKDFALNSRDPDVRVYWDKAYKVYRVNNKAFNTPEEAADCFIKETANGRLSNTDDEAELACRRNDSM